MDNHFFRGMWMDIIFDRQLCVIEIENPNGELFFGDKTLSMFVHQNIGVLSDRVDACNKQQALAVVDGIRRAQREKRNVYLQYVSLQLGEEAYVVAHAEYMDDGCIGFHATKIDKRDLSPVNGENQNTLVGENFNAAFQTIYENLPVGLEIYDCNGNLLDINDVEMQTMGVKNKKEVLGKNFFDNPNIPVTIKSKIREGQDVRYLLEYDFDKAAKEYYNTSMSGARYFDLMMTTIKDAWGGTDKYLLILRDVSEHMVLQKKYENLYNQCQTILESLPVGVELYANDGKLLYLNNMNSQIFGVDKEQIMEMDVNLFQNPNLPDSIKAAVRNKEKIQMRFPYNLGLVLGNKYYNSPGGEGIRQLEFNGTPVMNNAGEVENYVFIVNDLTEAIKTKGELRQNRLKIEMAMKIAGFTLWEFDTRTGIFFSENNKFNQNDRKIPLSLEDYMKVIHPDDLGRVKEILQELLEGKDKSYEFDLQMRYPGRSDWEYSTINGSPFEKDSDGKVIKYIGFRRNNTLLQKTKLLQDKILNSIPFPILIKDVEDNFRYVFCNQESKRMFGTIEQQSAYSVLNNEQVEKMQKTDMEVFVTGEPYFGQERIVLKDGRAYDTIVRKSVITDNGKRLLLNVRWDESLQNELKRRSRVLSISLDALNAYTWFYDPATKHITYGDGFAKTGGNDLRMNTIEKFADCIYEDDRSSFLANFYLAIQKGSGDFAFEYRIDFSGKNTYEWWECRGVIETKTRDELSYTYVFGMSVNIETHKEAELTLLKNKDELNNLIRQNELVLNNTNSGLAYISKDYVVQWENVSQCSASISYEAYKRGEHCYKSAHNRETPCENCVMIRAVHSKQVEKIKFELNNTRSVEIFATPVFDDEGEVDGIVIRVDDVTERENMIAELEQAKLQAEQSDKLKSAFLANMSHEIRTPLNAIVGFSDLLMIATEEEEKKEYMSIINTNNELLLKLISDILDLSKIEAGFVELKYEEFDLAKHFDEISSFMQQRVNNPNVRLTSVNPYSCCMVKLDKNRFAQVLTNYVTNAIKYTPKGFIEMGYRRVEEGIRLYVKDSGIGIAENKKSKVFNRFEKLDEFAQGTGLGLSICKAIVDACGGSVGFDTELGIGSLFWAVLPCTVDICDEDDRKDEQGEREAEISTPLDPSRISLERKTIVVAEDIQSNYLLASAMLQKEYDLIHAENGKQAVEFVRTVPRVDLVLMDMKMPEMDGMTATHEIRKFNTDVPIIALTAHAFDSDRQAALEAGCNDYLVKPIDKVKLMGMLEKYDCVGKI